MKKHINLQRVSIAICFVLILGIAYSAYSRSNGITGRTKKGSSPGCTCHGGSPTPGVNVQWIGPDTVTAGQTVNYSLVINGGPLVRAGTNIATRNGVLANADNSLRIQSGELTHVEPKAPSGGNVTFGFTYRAPNVPGLDTIFANGNSVNFDDENSGDSWNFASNRRVVVRTATGITSGLGTPFEFALSQNYPNPFNPETNIKFSLVSKSSTSLEITDITGRVVATLVNDVLPEGIYSVKWNASGYSSGIYFYKLVSGNSKDIKKLTLIK